MTTSIIILTLNRLDQTMRCIHSVRMYTDAPYEIIVVDNGSTDGTTGWLAAQPDIRLVANSGNLGFAAGCNQGAAIASGEHILLLNNDTVVTPRWLTQLLAALHRHEQVGIVGPMSNNVLRMQLTEASFGSEEDIRRFGEAYPHTHPHQWRDVSAVSGFCMLLRRSVWEQLGGLDTAFGIGGFEDIDIGYRALKTGWTLRIAGDTFVYHEGSLSFDGNGLNAQAIARENRRLFLRKWGFNPDRLLWYTDPAFLPGSGHAAAHPHHAPASQELPSGWYARGEQGRVFRIERGRKRPVASLEALRRLRVSPNRIAPVSEAFLQSMPDGAPLDAHLLPGGYPDVFVAQDPHGGMYVISHRIWYPISSAGALPVLGIRWNEAVSLTFPQIYSLHQGWPIGENAWEDHELLDYRLYRCPDGDLYYSEGQRLRRVPDAETLRRYGLHEVDAVMLPADMFVRVPRGFGLP